MNIHHRTNLWKTYCFSCTRLRIKHQFSEMTRLFGYEGKLKSYCNQNNNYNSIIKKNNGTSERLIMKTAFI